jgi:hypothetical protein
MLKRFGGILLNLSFDGGQLKDDILLNAAFL